MEGYDEYEGETLGVPVYAWFYVGLFLAVTLASLLIGCQYNPPRDFQFRAPILVEQVPPEAK